MRIRKVHDERYKRTRARGSKRPRPGSDQALERGLACRSGHNITSLKEVPQSQRSKLCAFCGRAKATHKCRSCGAHLCVKTPKQSNQGIRFPVNGPCCFLRYHGVTNFPQ